MCIGWTDHDVPHLLYESKVVDIGAVSLLLNEIVGVEGLVLAEDEAAEAQIVGV